jgi:hypothetical protein
MRRPLLIASLLAAEALLSPAFADCTCRSQGRDYDLGQSVCLQSPKGARIATCGMVLNNTSWQFTETPCTVSAVPQDLPEAGSERATAHGQTHAHTHGTQATLAEVSRAAP